MSAPADGPIAREMISTRLRTADRSGCQVRESRQAGFVHIGQLKSRVPQLPEHLLANALEAMGQNRLIPGSQGGLLPVVELQIFELDSEVVTERVQECVSILKAKKYGLRFCSRNPL